MHKVRIQQQYVSKTAAGGGKYLQSKTLNQSFKRQIQSVRNKVNHSILSFYNLRVTQNVINLTKPSTLSITYCTGKKKLQRCLQKKKNT
jgi:PIN domain nuclease of toxin-antitoxin system